MSKSKVIILLATFNGEKYIEQQIQSLINQTYSDWELIIRDDGSIDSTLSLIDRYSKIDSRIKLINDNSKNSGAFLNFKKLTHFAYFNCNPDYILYSDQDDFWFENKIQVLLNEIKKYERDNTNKPLLVHSNYKLADHKLNPLILKNNRYDEKKMSKQTLFTNIIFQNNVYGCTTIINRKLIEKVVNEELVCENFDHFVALIAAWYGNIFYVNEELMIYRQHFSNVSGSYFTRKPYYLRLFDLFREIKREGEEILKSIYYLDYFREKNSLKKFAYVKEEPFYLKVSKRILWYCINNIIIKNTLHETLFFYISLFFNSITNFKTLDSRRVSKIFNIYD